MDWEELKKTILFSDWYTACNILGIFCTAYIRVTATVKSGRRLTVYVAGSGFISREEEFRNSGGTLDNLKKAKKECMEMSLEDFLNDMLEHRTGLKGHRGYFKVVSIQEGVSNAYI